MPLKIKSDFACSVGQFLDSTVITESGAVKSYFLDSVKSLRELSKEDLVQKRYEKLVSVGAFKEES